MRVENSAVDNATSDLYTPSITKGAPDAQKASSVVNAGTDSSSLSSSSELVNLAKNLMPADRSSRFQAVSAAMSAGQYQADPSAVSQALVNEHIDA